MCYDRSSELLYVLGGRIAGTELCSGLYAFHVTSHRWLCLAPDQSIDSAPQQAFLPRSGHAMVFHPVRLYRHPAAHLISCLLLDFTQTIYHWWGAAAICIRVSYAQLCFK